MDAAATNVIAAKFGLWPTAEAENGLRRRDIVLRGDEMRLALYRIESIWRNKVTIRDLQSNRRPFELHEGDEFAVHLAGHGPRTMTLGDVLNHANEMIYDKPTRQRHGALRGASKAAGTPSARPDSGHQQHR